MNIQNINQHQFTAHASGLIHDQFENLDAPLLIGFNDALLKPTDRDYLVNYIKNMTMPVALGRYFQFEASPTFDHSPFTYKVFSYTSSVEYSKNDVQQFAETFRNIGMGLPAYLEMLRNTGVAQKRYRATMFGTGQGDGIMNEVPVVPWPFLGVTIPTMTTDEKVAFLEHLLKQVNDIQTGMLNMGKELVIVTTQRISNWLTTQILPLQFSQLAGAGVDSVGGTFTRFVKKGFNTGHSIVIQTTRLLEDIVEETPNGAVTTDGMLMFYPNINPTQGFGMKQGPNTTNVGLNNSGIGLANTIMASMPSEIAHTPIIGDKSSQRFMYERRETIPTLIREGIGSLVELAWA